MGKGSAMGEIHQVKVFLRHGKKYLLLQKAKDLHREHIGLWEVPGGKIQYNETAEQAVVREVKEETGLNGLILKELSPLVLEKEGIRTYTRVYVVTTSSLKITMSNEHSAYQWVTVKQAEARDNVLYRELFLKYLSEAEQIR